MAHSDLNDLTQRLREFAGARDWEQFHTPKNLAMALSVEVAELAEHFQWLTPDEASSLKNDPATVDALASEIADVAIYLLRLADVLDVDVAEAVRRKMASNEERFPSDLVRGRATLPEGRKADG